MADDYIKREEAEKIFVEYSCVKYHVAEMGDTNEANRIMLMFRENAKKLFSIAPSADVVPVVRCGDCKWWEPSFKGCKANPCVEARKPNDFCSYGERKDND